MGFQFPELSVANITYGVAGFVATIIVIAKLLVRGPNVSIFIVNRLNLYNFHQLDAIPAVGSSNWLGSWWAGFKYLTNAQSIVSEGYKKVRLLRPMVRSSHHNLLILVVQIRAIQGCGTQPLDSHSR